MPKTRTPLPEIWDAGKALSHPLRIALYETIHRVEGTDPARLVEAHDAGEHATKRRKSHAEPGCPKCFARTDSLSPNELARHLDEPLTNVSYHVRMLHDLGVIREVKTEPRRGALEHYYAATCDIVIGVEPVHHNGKGPA